MGKIRSILSSKRFLSSKVMVVVSAIAILFYFSGTVMAAQSTQLNYNTASTSDGNSYYNGNKKPLVLKSIALLPMENLSGAPIAPEVVREYIKRELKNKGWVLISRDDIVEEFLAKRRVRYTGAITRLVVREMGKALGVDAVMVGSVNYYTGSGTSVMVGVSCRLLSTTDGSIIWADNLAYTGRDYQGFLGLGAVKSLDILASMVVKDLVSSIADKFFIRDTALSPFEIERVITYPNISKVGDVVEIRVKILPLYEAPTQVRAMIQGEEHILEKISDSEYRGLIYAPESEGTYMVDVMAMDRTMIPFTFNSAGKVVVDSTAPEIEIDVSTKIFSPRNRGSVKIDTRLLRVEEIEEWRFTIYDEKGQRIKSERGFGELPGRIIWKGETDWRMLVDDGHYSLKLMVKDRAGNVSSKTSAVWVKNTAPDITVDVDLLEDIVLFSFDYSPDEPIESWALTIHDRDGNTYKKLQGDGPVPTTLEYALQENDMVSKMAFSMEATDVAGNIFKLTKTLPFFFNRKMPFAELERGDSLPDEF